MLSPQKFLNFALLAVLVFLNFGAASPLASSTQTANQLFKRNAACSLHLHYWSDGRIIDLKVFAPEGAGPHVISELEPHAESMASKGVSIPIPPYGARETTQNLVLEKENKTSWTVNFCFEDQAWDSENKRYCKVGKANGLWGFVGDSESTAVVWSIVLGKAKDVVKGKGKRGRKRKSAALEPDEPELEPEVARAAKEGIKGRGKRGRKRKSAAPEADKPEPEPEPEVAQMIDAPVP
ncbi:hypothetical protein G7Y89_g13158 [Cudoniella acicularis]|uniref:Uncharacterized protein n=1 Tax=Cudoniella acicularis TaxID=354080 RepID=A0A8H4RB93_9HELO|nr:hypothetical protein G7Y89_g13158 [Cudoniella acicularis]